MILLCPRSDSSKTFGFYQTEDGFWSYFAGTKHDYIYEFYWSYCQTPNISHTLVGNKIIDHSDVVGASPAGAAPITSSFST